MCCPPVRQLGPPHLSLSCFLHSWQYHLPAQGGRWQQCVTSPTDGRCASRAAALQRALRPGTGWSIICAPPPGSCVLACHLPLGRFSSVSPTQPKWNHSYGQSATAENGRCMVQLATEPARRGLVNKPPSWSTTSSGGSSSGSSSRARTRVFARNHLSKGDALAVAVLGLAGVRHCQRLLHTRDSAARRQSRAQPPTHLVSGPGNRCLIHQGCTMTDPKQRTNDGQLSFTKFHQPPHLLSHLVLLFGRELALLSTAVLALALAAAAPRVHAAATHCGLHRRQAQPLPLLGNLCSIERGGR